MGIARAVLAVVFVLLALEAAPAADVRRGAPVRFPSLALAGTKAVTLRGYWSAPDEQQGRGRFGAVVLLHGCGGPQVSSHRWAAQITRWGYGALVVDSFGPRRIGKVCGRPDIMRSSERAGDAYGALMFLQTVRGVDPDSIAVIGWSHGGSAALWAVDREWAPNFRPYPWVRFKAAAAFYPGCAPHPDGFAVPVLILMGGADDWAPVSPCKRMVKTLQADGQAIQIMVYPGATHAFDAVRSTVMAYGHVLEYHPVATEDAQGKVRRFLGKTLP
jgi:dienelactone hydrolase